jgi:hypothetical protein
MQSETTKLEWECPNWADCLENKAKNQFKESKIYTTTMEQWNLLVNPLIGLMTFIKVLKKLILMIFLPMPWIKKKSMSLLRFNTRCPQKKFILNWLSTMKWKELFNKSLNLRKELLRLNAKLLLQK